MKIYAIKDNKLGFDMVFTMSNNMAAIRAFGDWCGNEQSLYNKHPEDYDMYCVGDMDENSGAITPEVTFLEKASTFVKKKKA